MAMRKRYVFVCINRRPDDNPKGCCAAKGSEKAGTALMAAAVTSAEMAMIFKVSFIGRLLLECDQLFSP